MISIYSDSPNPVVSREKAGPTSPILSPLGTFPILLSSKSDALPCATLPVSPQALCVELVAVDRNIPLGKYAFSSSESPPDASFSTRLRALTEAHRIYIRCLLSTFP